MSRLLIIDDDPRSVDQLKREVKALRWEMSVALDQEAGYLALRTQRFDFALVDIRLKSDSGDLHPDAEVGYATIRFLRSSYPAMKIIAVTAFDEKSEVNTNAVKAGADDFWSKRPDVSEKLLAKIRRLSASNDQSVTPDKPVTIGFKDSVPRQGAPTIENVQMRIKKFAKTDVTILLVGETGTGKGYYASEIHRLSSRKNKPFLVLNCPQQTKDTIVSELFGHKKGSFTGAYSDRKGIAESADGGTLFLDEIEALDYECQGTILRFIQDKEVKPHGSNKTEVVDVRFIVATNRDLGEMVARGEFREDLYSRLSGVVISIPPLRNRGVDEKLRLAKHFCRSFKQNNSALKGYSDVRVTEAALRALVEHSHSWSGNVRELKQVIDAALFESGGRISRLEEFLHHIQGDGQAFQPRSSASIPSDSKQTLFSTREESILHFVRKRGKASRSEIVTAMHLGSTITWKVLSGLLAKGAIRREGNGRGVVYVIQQNVDLEK